jgi:hypothetical protein
MALAFAYGDMVVVDVIANGAKIKNMVQLLCIDKSGSMGGRRINMVNTCIHSLKSFDYNVPTFITTWNHEYDNTYTSLRNFEDIVPEGGTSRVACVNSLKYMMRILYDMFGGQENMFLSVILLGDGEFREITNSDTMRKELETEWLDIAKGKSFFHLKVGFISDQANIPKSFTDILGKDDSDDRVVKITNPLIFTRLIHDIYQTWTVAKICFDNKIKLSGAELTTMPTKEHRFIVQKDNRYKIFINTNKWSILPKGYTLAYVNLLYQLPAKVQRRIYTRISDHIESIDFDIDLESISALYNDEIDLIQSYQGMDLDRKKYYLQQIYTLYSKRTQIDTGTSALLLSIELDRAMQIQNSNLEMKSGSVNTGQSRYRKRGGSRSIETIEKDIQSLKLKTESKYDDCDTIVNNFRMGINFDVDLPAITTSQLPRYKNRRRTFGPTSVAALEIPEDDLCEICYAQQGNFLVCSFTDKGKQKYHNKLCLRCIGLEKCPICRKTIKTVDIKSGRCVYTYSLQFDKNVLTGATLKARKHCHILGLLLEPYNELAPLSIQSVSHTLVNDNKKMFYKFVFENNIKHLTRLLSLCSDTLIDFVILTRGEVPWVLDAIKYIFSDKPQILNTVTAIMSTHGDTVLSRDKFEKIRSVKKQYFTEFDVDDVEIEKGSICDALADELTPLLYIDDNIEECKNKYVHTYPLETEGNGINVKNIDDVMITIKEKNIKIVVCDFDCTMTAKHLYKTQSGGNGYVQPFSLWLENFQKPQYVKQPKRRLSS